MVASLVSIIMPTFNRKALIFNAIDSVVAQTYSNWELIIVDDGSVDGTAGAIAERYGNESRIKYLYQENQGQASARNNGIAASSGSYIAFLDSDNLWLPERLSEGVAILDESPDVGLCYANVIFIDAEGQELHRNNMQRYSGHVFDKLLVDNFVSMNTVLVRKKILPSNRPFNELNRLDEDYELWLDMSVNNKYFYIDKCLAEYRVEGDRVSDSFLTRLKANEKTLKKVIEKYNIDKEIPSVKKGLSLHYLRQASILARQGNVVDVLSAINTSWRFKINFIITCKILIKYLLAKFSIKI